MRMQTTSVAQTFQGLLGILKPVNSEVNALSSHRETIEQAMRGEFAGFNPVEAIGNHTRSPPRGNI